MLYFGALNDSSSQKPLHIHVYVSFVDLIPFKGVFVTATKFDGIRS